MFGYVTVNKPEGYNNITNESIELHETLSNAGSGLFRGHWKIEWKDNDGKIVLTEVLYWTLDPMDGTETWMEKNFKPARLAHRCTAAQRKGKIPAEIRSKNRFVVL